MTFNLQATIDKQQQLVISLQTKAAEGVEGAAAELASAIAGLRDLQAMANKPSGVTPSASPSGYLIR